MNIIGMLRPKYSTTYLEAEDTLRDGLSIMRKSGYTAVPVIDREGRYVGTVKEGDFLWQILEHGEEILDVVRIKDIIKEGWNLAATDEEDVNALISRAMEQNFVPVVDDRECYIGIITRRDIIQAILNKKIDSRYIVLQNEAISL
ncbi:MAG: CBS domain-containing protein [Lachnospiraceae bacterium]|nr:CBS domain-containing protein [Lachnospiraceae bacterium]